MGEWRQFFCDWWDESWLFRFSCYVLAATMLLSDILIALDYFYDIAPGWSIR